MIARSEEFEGMMATEQALRMDSVSTLDIFYSELDMYILTWGNLALGSPSETRPCRSFRHYDQSSRNCSKNWLSMANATPSILHKSNELVLWPRKLLSVGLVGATSETFTPLRI